MRVEWVQPVQVEWVVVACGDWERGAAACVVEDGSCSCAAASCSCWDSYSSPCSCCGSCPYSFPCSCCSWEDVGCDRRSPAAAAAAVESLAAADSSQGSLVGSVAAAGVAVDAVGPLRLRDVSCGPWCDDDDDAGAVEVEVEVEVNANVWIQYVL